MTSEVVHDGSRGLYIADPVAPEPPRLGRSCHDPCARCGHRHRVTVRRESNGLDDPLTYDLACDQDGCRCTASNADYDGTAFVYNLDDYRPTLCDDHHLPGPCGTAARADRHRDAGGARRLAEGGDLRGGRGLDCGRTDLLGRSRDFADQLGRLWRAAVRARRGRSDARRADHGRGADPALGAGSERLFELVNE